MGAGKIGWVGKELLHDLLEMEAERELSRWIAIQLGVRLCIGFEGEEQEVKVCSLPLCFHGSSGPWVPLDKVMS